MSSSFERRASAGRAAAPGAPRAAGYWELTVGDPGDRGAADPGGERGLGRDRPVRRTGRHHAHRPAYHRQRSDGHAPGLIGLWREQDRLALCTDTIYTLDPLTGEFGHARTPLEFANLDTQKAKASIRKLAQLEPNEVWPGHADPVRGDDVPDQLERAART